MKRMIARRVLNIVVVTVAIVAMLLLAGITLFGESNAASRTLGIVVWALWGAIAIGFAVRLVVALVRRRRAGAEGPVASAADAVQDLYLGRVTTRAPQREPDEYSAYGSPLARDGDRFTNR